MNVKVADKCGASPHITNMSLDWTECATCHGTGAQAAKECSRCNAVGWLFTRLGGFTGRMGEAIVGRLF